MEALTENQQGTVISSKDRQLLEKQRVNAVALWRQRKRITKNILDGIMEGYPDSMKKLCEDIGIETDEDKGDVMPSR